jgi:maltooligosyltrehalose trehalohydrolase
MLGAVPEDPGTRFRVWAPDAVRLEVVLEDGRRHLLQPGPGGHHQGVLSGVGAGARYRFSPDGRGPFPDPASRRQPLGVHGPSEVVDPSTFRWTDASWPGLSMDDLSVYELHVGTFTPEGTFAAAARRLDHLVDLGVTALELMPVAQAPGSRGWGYDGVFPYAPASALGTPDDLRALVDAAHRAGLGVLLDVVYNHLGPDGNYTGCYAAAYRSSRHKTPWGDGLNFDGEGSAAVREFFIGNALHWLAEYHLDGLRLDATHAILDDGPVHVLGELAERAHALRPRALVIAEDDRNEARLVRPASDGGLGLDGVWADDLHHALRRRVAGDRDGYFADFTGSSEEIARTVRQGWLFTGQPAPHFHGGPRGTDPSGVPAERFVVCLQNHDQVGNRALGERLHHVVDPASYRAALALVLLAPETPLLFMGQEWAASTPFLYFTDHEPGLGKLVTEGRRREFARFEAWADPALRERIPDPQAAATFEASKLRWDERLLPPHAAVLALHRSLLRLRRELVLPRRAGWTAAAAGPDGVVLGDGERTVVVRLDGAGPLAVDAGKGVPRLLLSTEDPGFSHDPLPATVEAEGGRVTVRFRRPGAVVLGS